MSEHNTALKSNNGHAVASPSGSIKWMNCAGSLAQEKDQPNEATLASATGTAAHFLGSEGLTAYGGDLPKSLVGHQIIVTATSAHWIGYTPMLTDDEKILFTITVTADTLEKVQGYMDRVTALAAGRTLLVEQALDISMITGEEGAKGTGDAVILAADIRTIIVVDLKYGHVEVDAKENYQLMMYGLAAYHQAGGEFSEYETVKMVIDQPNLYTTDEFECSVVDLIEFGERAGMAANLALVLREHSSPEEVALNLNPGDHCKKGYCRARGDCRKLAEHVQEFCDFEELPLMPSDITHLTPAELGVMRSKTKLVKDWADHIDKHVATQMKSGVIVPGFKLVKGQEGNRAWKDEQAAEELMVKSMKVKHDVAYKKVLISPTAAAAAAKEGTIGPRQWPRLQAMIGRSPAGLTVAPESDKREAVDASPPDGSEFDNLGETPAVEEAAVNESQFY